MLGSVSSGATTEQRVRCEKELAEVALEDRGDSYELEMYRDFSQAEDSRSGVDYERLGLIPVHREVDSWICVGADPQLAIAIEEIVNTFSPALSVELLLYNVLGSNSESATCLVRYLVNYYSSHHVAEHIKNTLRNMIRWTVLAGFVPCLFLPWRKLRTLGLGLSGKATVTNLVSSNPAVHRDTYRKPRSDERRNRARRRRTQRRERWFCSTGPEVALGVERVRCGVRGGQRDPNPSPYTPKPKPRPRPRPRPCFRRVWDGLSPPDAAAEAVQEREAHERALPSLLDVPLDRLADTLKLLMSNSVPTTQVSVVCKIIGDWVEKDVTLRRDPLKQTELKMAIVALWGVMKTFEHGRCPVIPDCRASTCLAFYDTETALVTAVVDGVLYRHISLWDSCCSQGPHVSSLAKRAHLTVSSWATLFHKILEGLTVASTRRVYTSTGVERSSLTHLADVILSSGGEQQQQQQGGMGLAVAGNAFGRPLLDNLSRFLASDRQPDMFGLNAAQLPDVFLRSGIGTTVSEHKSASVSHSLSKMMASMILEGKEVLLVRRFLGEVTRHPRLALERLKSDCKDRGLLHMAEGVTKQLERPEGEGGEVKPEEPVTELGSDVKLVCSYPSSVSVAHLEETLSMWTNFWRSALSGFSQFNRRHNTIQYNNRDTVRELESGSPVHVFHCMLVALLNTSGVTFADSLSGRRPDSSLTVNDIMLTRESLHPTAYGLLLANKLGLRPSDVKCEAEREREVMTAGLLSTTSVSNPDESWDPRTSLPERTGYAETRGETGGVPTGVFGVQSEESLHKAPQRTPTQRYWDTAAPLHRRHMASATSRI